MHWRHRLLQIALAGGLAVPACANAVENDTSLPVTGPNTGPSGAGYGRCNGNPDPCCVSDTSPACLAKRADAATGDATIDPDAQVDANGNNDAPDSDPQQDGP